MVAAYWVKAIVAIVVCGMVWYMGNMVLFGETGFATVVENLSTGEFGATDAAIRWFWSNFPFIILLGAAVYVVYAAIRQETGEAMG